MKIELTSVTRDDLEHWVIGRVITHDDGTQEQGVYVMPVDILEWRAAEYGIDPEDTDTLLDVVLAEHHLDPGEMQRSPLYEDTTIENARRNHLARCAQAKLRCRLSTRGKDHVLNRVRQESPRDPEAITLKKRLAEHARIQQMGFARAAQSSTIPENRVRIEALRQAVRELTGEEM